jgi:hypothetical protein
MKKVYVVLAILVFVWACSSDSGEVNVPPPTSGGTEEPIAVNFERSAMLINWADNIIIPSYEAFSGKMADLKTAFEVFKNSPDEANLSPLRAAWLDAYKVWQRIDMFEIGPAETAGLRLNLNTYPTNVDLLEANVVDGNSDLSLSSNRAAKGFPALDYLINGLAENDIAIVSKLSGSATDSQYIAYIDVVLADMQTSADQVLSVWKSSYRDTFVENDGASSTASVDRFVNDYIFYYEKFLRAGKIGIPLGVFSGSPLPGNLEGYYKADISNELFLEGLDAVQDFFNGKHFGKSSSGESLGSYLDALNSLKNGEDLNTIINDQFNKARDMVSSLDGFRQEIENNTPPTDMLLAYDEVQRAVPLLKVDMVSAMSISIDFVDADGD